MSDLTRRDALKAAGLGSLGLWLPGTVEGESPGAGADVEAHDARARHAAAGITQSVARWCYQDIPLEDFCRSIAAFGLPAIDLLEPEEWPVARDHGLAVSCGYAGAGTIEDGLSETANHATIIGGFERTIPRAAAEDVPNVICFFGNRRGMSDADGIRNSIACLRECAPIAESEGVTILVEVLNSKPGGHVDYIGDRMGYALEIMRAVGSSRIKILYDIYHMQIMEGDIIRTVTEARDWIGHYHTGGVPGRAEIDETQELYYPAIVRAIGETGFEGFMAHEFIPRSDDPLRSLRAAVELCTV